MNSFALNGTITEGIIDDFECWLAGKSGTATIVIDSPGGSFFAANRAYGVIGKRGNVHAVVRSLSASAAAYLMLACSRIQIYSSGSVMLHSAWLKGGGGGNERELEDQLNAVKAVNRSMAAALKARTKQSDATIRSWLSRDTFFRVDEAVRVGLCDEVVALRAPTACYRVWPHGHRSPLHLNFGSVAEAQAESARRRIPWSEQRIVAMTNRGWEVCPTGNL